MDAREEAEDVSRVAAEARVVLAVNTGSSSVRLALVAVEDGSTRILAQQRSEGREDASGTLAGWLAPLPARPEVVAHRIVLGGEGLVEPLRLDPALEERLASLASRSPLHLPPALAWIRAARAVDPDLPAVAVFDSAFFARLPEHAARYALPRELAAELGLFRFGYHGLAHAALLRRWRALRPDLAAGGRLITLQLGAGCSAAAVAGGVPLDTSMGFSPGEGLVMATRAGDVDPALVTHLQRVRGWGPDEVDRLLGERSGLLGLSGTSGDVRVLLASSAPAARAALDVFVHRVRKVVGAYLAVLGGADGLVFSGGIGENAPALRAAVLAGLEPLGIVLDPAANLRAAGREARLSLPSSPVDVRVVPADEAGELAREAVACLSCPMIP